MKKNMKAYEKAPNTYRNRKKIPERKALELEAESGISSFVGAVKSLERKGYFEPHARPWKLGFQDMGLGRENVAVLDRFGDLVVEVPLKSNAALIVAAVNAYKPQARKSRKKSKPAESQVF